MARAYDVEAIEKKWQRLWEEEGTYQIDNDDPREKYYALCMYPYPSGAAHQGHVRNYTFGDLAVRYQTMQGKGVLSPFGFDSFGLPAENAAIKTGTHPRVFTEARMAELKSSLIRLGAVYDWRREIWSHDPEYIKWTQLIFLKLWEAGLAYRAQGPRQLVPRLPDGPRQRAGPRRRHLRASGDLVSGATWSSGSSGSPPTPTSSSRRSTTSTGPSGSRSCSATGSAAPRAPSSTCRPGERSDLKLRVFTTRPDTSFGMTYAVIAPEHPLLDALTTDAQRRPSTSSGTRASEETDIERMSEGDPARSTSAARSPAAT